MVCWNESELFTHHWGNRFSFSNWRNNKGNSFHRLLQGWHKLMSQWKYAVELIVIFLYTEWKVTRDVLQFSLVQVRINLALVLFSVNTVIFTYSHIAEPLIMIFNWVSLFLFPFLPFGGIEPVILLARRSEASTTVFTARQWIFVCSQGVRT